MNQSGLFLIGATHRSAPFGFREKIALGGEGEAALAVRLKQSSLVQEFVVLNTCNRVEVYVAGDKARGLQAVIDLFCAERHISALDFAQFGFVREDRGVVDHLCNVAAGLDSQILGETEIFGQVKKAYAVAQARASAGPILNRLFQKAFQAAKHVRATTGITTGQVSVANVAVDLASEIFGKLDDCRVLVIGAGDMAEKSLRAFRSRGTQHITVANRHAEKAAILAQEHGAEVVAYEQRAVALCRADIIVCSTSSPHTVVSTDAVAAAIIAARGRPLLLIDLAMPRNIEADAANLENVFLYNLDDLALVAAKNREARQVHAEKGRGALVSRTEAIWGQLQLQFSTLPAPADRGGAVGLPALA